MSIATTKSALSFAYLRDALPTVGPVAKAFNFEIEDTLALLGKLADSGFDASSAATATRNILLNLADSGGKLATALGGPVKTLPELVSGLQELKDKGVDLNTTLQLTDKRSVAAFNAFLQSADKITPLRDAITGVEDDLDQMASTMGDNVKGAMAGLGSAWEALMIKMSENTSGPLKDMINWFTGLLRDLKSVFSGVVAFVITLISGKLLRPIITFFAKGNAVLNASVTNYKLAEEQKIAATQKRTAAQDAYLKTYIAHETKQNGRRLASAAQLKKSLTALEAAKLAEKRAFDAASVASTKAAAVQSMNAWQRSNAILQAGWKRLAITLKGLWSTVGPMVLITALAGIVGKLVNVYNEAKRIKNIFADYKKSSLAAGDTQEIARLQTLAKIMNNRANSQHAINAAQTELQKMLGVENKSQEELNKLIGKRVELLKEAAMAEHAFNTVGEYTEKNAKLAGDVGLSSNQLARLAKLYTGRNTSDRNRFAYQKAIGEELALNGNRNKGISISDVSSAIEEYLQNMLVINDATKRAGENLEKVTASTIVPPAGDPSSEELQKQQERYAQSLRELNVRREVEKMTVDEYNKAYAELSKKALIEAMSSDDTSIVNSDYTKKLAAEYSKAMQDIVLSTSSEILDNIQKEIATEDFRVEVTPILGRRDTTFDYKASETDRISADLDIWKDYKAQYESLQKDLKSKNQDLSENLQTELNNAISKVDSLEDALKIAQVKEDIKSFSRELNEGLYSGVKNIASSSDRMVSAFESLRDVMNDVDASGWERIMAVWNAMTNTIDGLMSIIKTIETLTELTNKLARAKEAEAAIDTATTATKVTNKTAETTAEITALGTQTAAEVTASTAKTTAASVEMAAKSTAAYAYIPFAGPALAAAQIATMQALIAAAAIPKFASGGIVTGGPSSGDKILARVNAGEMILNARQQSNLFEAINSGKMGGDKMLASTVTTKVRSKDLILTINNELKSQGKKPIG